MEWTLQKTMSRGVATSERVPVLDGERSLRLEAVERPSHEHDLHIAARIQVRTTRGVRRVHQARTKVETAAGTALGELITFAPEEVTTRSSNLRGWMLGMHHHLHNQYHSGSVVLVPSPNE